MHSALKDTMQRSIVELTGSTGFIKSLVNNPRDRFAELVPSHKEGGVTFEQRYYVVGENKAHGIISGDSDDVQALFVRRFSERSSYIRYMP